MVEPTALIPQPVHCSLLSGQFTLSHTTQLIAQGAAADVAAWFAQSIAPATGYKLPLLPDLSTKGDNSIEFRLDTALHALGSEGYRLQVGTGKVELAAFQPAGLFYAAQTLRQLLPAEIFSPQPVSGVQWSIPCLEIEDTPRFAWRGAMLDVGRHFMPKEFVLKFIDLLALHKLNTFHWHLTEDQGWRIEIKKYPRLTQVGAWRKQTVVGHADTSDDEVSYDGTPHGGFYTQDDIRAVVEYARQRFINVIPEIEMPGHAQAAIAAYPQLGNTGRQLEVATLWGIHDHVYNVEEGTLRFLQDVLDEVLDLFPSPFIHTGGDECPKREWRESPAAQERMQRLGLKDEDELQAYFIRCMDAFLTDRGRRLIGWDEILEGGLAPGATVMSWRGEEGGITAANAGHDVVMAPNGYTYLDFYQLEEEGQDFSYPLYLPLSRVYEYDPIPVDIDPARVGHVLGTQAQLWSEYIPDPARVEYMAFPRLCALAEVAWTPAAGKNFTSFQSRLHSHLRRLDGLRVNYCRKIE